MRFSIIVPIYNIEEYIRRCIESIIYQSFKDFELILVDDGSNDSSPSICDYYSRLDNRITVIHKKNGGLVSARRAGIRHAKGEYSLYVDGDDWIAPNSLSKINTILMKYPVDIICFGFIEVTRNKNKRIEVNSLCGLYNKKDIITKIYPFLIEDKKSKYFNHNACGKVFKTKMLKEAQKRVSFDIVMSEDAAVTIPLICSASSMYIMSNCLYYYNRLNDNSITKKKKPLSWDGPYLLQEHFLMFNTLNNSFFKKQIYRNTLHNLFNVAVSQFNSEENYKFNKQVIIQRITDEKYIRAIKKGHFDYFTKGWFARTVLKYKAVFIIYMYWRKKYFAK